MLRRHECSYTSKTQAAQLGDDEQVNHGERGPALKYPIGTRVKKVRSEMQ